MTAPHPTSAAILRHASVFLDDALSSPDLRRRIPSSSSAAAAAPLLQALSLLSQALDSGDHGGVVGGGGGGGAGASPTRPSPAALRAVEKLLLSLPAAAPLSALLLALTAAACRRPPRRLRPRPRPRAPRGRPRPLRGPLRPPPPPHNPPLLAMAAAVVLSRMSGEQAAELKDLERGYEEVLDANSRVYAQYLKKILESGDRASDTPGPPELIWTSISIETEEIKEVVVEEVVVDDNDDDDDKKEEVGEETRREIGLRNGRYNPIWAEANQSIEPFSRKTTGKLRNVAKYPSLYPQRVSLHLLFRQPSNGDNYSANLKSQRSLTKSPPLYPYLLARQTSTADRSSEANFVSDRSRQLRGLFRN